MSCVGIYFHMKSYWMTEYKTAAAPLQRQCLFNQRVLLGALWIVSGLKYQFYLCRYVTARELVTKVTLLLLPPEKCR